MRRLLFILDYIIITLKIALAGTVYYASFFAHPNPVILFFYQRQLPLSTIYLIINISRYFKRRVYTLLVIELVTAIGAFFYFNAPRDMCTAIGAVFSALLIYWGKKLESDTLKSALPLTV